MKYRRHTECMTQEEVEAVMKVLLPESQVTSLERREDSDCINVNFELQGREGTLIFYSDDVDNVPEWAPLENETFYQVYMIANGYSRIWVNEADAKPGEWMLKIREHMEERRRKQMESDSILQELLQKSRETLDELQDSAEHKVPKDKLNVYRQINEQAMERLEHTSYVMGVSDTVSMLHLMDNQLNMADLATELEEIVTGYQNLHGLIETFGDGAKTQLGDYDIAKGIFAIADALYEKNEMLKRLFEKVTETE